MLPHHRKIKNSHLFRDSSRPGYEKCNGCRVCTLPCPVWHETRDISLTHCGRARAIQCGASPEDIRESIMACILCGACESVCPFGIDTVGMTIDLRYMLNKEKSVSASTEERISENTNRKGIYPRLFLPGKQLRSHEQLILNIHNILDDSETAIAYDDGSDISRAVESGASVSDERKEQFIRSVSGARELVVADGILQRVLKKWLPDLKVTWLGMAILNKINVKGLLGPEDLYIIETRGYNGAREEMVREYDLIRKKTGCQMNMDLHRSAIPTGSGSVYLKVVSPEEQASWIIKGREFKRIIVENPEDISVFRKVTDARVINVSDLIKGRNNG
ncbi:MAG: (Fe-S)-binding protein [Desulfobacteraceae bacterium]|jgi:ferredoxin